MYQFTNLEGIVPDPSRNRYTVDDDVSSEICLDTSVKVVQRILCMALITFISTTEILNLLPLPLACWGQTFSSTDAEMRGTKRTASEAEVTPSVESIDYMSVHFCSYV